MNKKKIILFLFFIGTFLTENINAQINQKVINKIDGQVETAVTEGRNITKQTHHKFYKVRLKSKDLIKKEEVIEYCKVKNYDKGEIITKDEIIFGKSVELVISFEFRTQKQKEEDEQAIVIAKLKAEAERKLRDSIRVVEENRLKRREDSLEVVGMNELAEMNRNPEKYIMGTWAENDYQYFTITNKFNTQLLKIYAPEVDQSAFSAPPEQLHCYWKFKKDTKEFIFSHDGANYYVLFKFISFPVPGKMEVEQGGKIKRLGRTTEELLQANRSQAASDAATKAFNDMAFSFLGGLIDIITTPPPTVIYTY